MRFQFTRLFLLAVLILACNLEIRASHYSAGEIFYEWIGDEPGKGVYDYRVYATVFRNIGGVSIGTGNLTGCFYDENSTGSTSFTLSYLDPNNPLPIAYKHAWKDSGPHPSDVNSWDVQRYNCTPNSYQVSEYRYVGEIILSGKSKKWKIAITPPCCRDQNDNLVGNDGFYLKVDLNNTLGPTSSPRIISPAIGEFCVTSANSPLLYWSQLAKEFDGDSIVIDFASSGSLGGSCRNETVIPYDSALSASQQFYTNGPINVNKRKGVFKFRPAQAGMYAVKIEVREFRYDSVNQNFEYIGNTARELAFAIHPTCNPSAFASPEICMVGFDPASKGMTLFFDEDEFHKTDSIFVFRGNRTFHLNSDSLGQPSLIDTNNNGFNYPPERNSLYALNKCAIYTDTGAIHQNMYLQATTGGNGMVNLNWTPYQGKSINAHRLYAVDSNSNQSLITQVPASTYSTSISNPNAGTEYYMIEAVLDSSDCLPSGYNYDGPLAAATVSNIGLSEQGIEALEIYPNPARENITLHWPLMEKRSYTIYTAEGKMVKGGYLQGYTNTIEVSGLSSGLYFLRVNGLKGSKTFKKQ